MALTGMTFLANDNCIIVHCGDNLQETGIVRFSHGAQFPLPLSSLSTSLRAIWQTGSHLFLAVCKTNYFEDTTCNLTFDGGDKTAKGSKMEHRWLIDWVQLYKREDHWQMANHWRRPKKFALSLCCLCNVSPLLKLWCIMQNWSPVKKRFPSV